MFDWFTKCWRPQTTTWRRRGVFVAFEGCEGTGKTTQARRLVTTLENNNVPVVYIKFPIKTCQLTGQHISNYTHYGINCRSDEAAALYSRNRWLQQRFIQSVLMTGTTVVADRYVHAGIAYNTSPNTDMLKIMEQERGLIVPDIVIYLKFCEYISTDHSHRFGITMSAARQVEVANRYSVAKIIDASIPWIEIDADDPVDDIAEMVHTVVTESFVYVSTIKKLGC